MTRLLEVLNHDDVEPTEIEEVLQYDPVLVGKVIMLVNSPLFALNGEITTIREGIVLLGLSPLRSMTLAYCAGSIRSQRLPRQGACRACRYSTARPRRQCSSRASCTTWARC